MKVSYKPLWNLLLKRNMKKKDLIRLSGISDNCMAKLGRDKYISMHNIERICEALECTPSDVFLFDNNKEL